MTKEEFEKVFVETAEKSGVAKLARKNQFAENLQVMMIELQDKLCASEQPSEDLEEAADCYLDTISLVGFMEGDYDGTQILDAFRTGADWQKNRDKQILSTLYDDCSCLKDSLDKVTTGNLSHRIGNIKFSITGMQVFIKHTIGDKIL